MDAVYIVVPLGICVVFMLGIMLGLLFAKADYEQKAKHLIAGYEAEQRRLMADIETFEQRMDERFGRKVS